MANTRKQQQGDLQAALFGSAPAPLKPGWHDLFQQAELDADLDALTEQFWDEQSGEQQSPPTETTTQEE
jgi:hypothetical protein